MDQYTCVIIDDEPLARRLLTNYVEKTPQLKLMATFKSALEVADYLQTEKVDLLFCDIQMPGMSGVGFVENHQNLPAVIFTTAYEEYAAKAFELDVIDYLVKPFSIERFQKSIKKFEDYHLYKLGADPDKKHLMLNANHGFIKIRREDILYIEAHGEYMKFILDEQRPELVYIRMKELELLLGDGFARIHKSYLVNKDRISKLSGGYVTIGNEKLKVSRFYKSSFMESMS